MKEEMIEEERCHCGLNLEKEILPKDEGGFWYVLICPIHGAIMKRDPTYKETMDFNG